MAQTIQIKRGTAAALTSENPTLAAGEYGLETDTGRIKIGDGSTAWTSLGYIEDDMEFPTKNSIEQDDGDLQLVGDEESPGNDKVYGTDNEGNRTWKDDPSGAVDVQEDGSDVVTDADKINFDGTNFNVTDETGGVAGIAIDTIDGGVIS